MQYFKIQSQINLITTLFISFIFYILFVFYVFSNPLEKLWMPIYEDDPLSFEKMCKEFLEEEIWHGELLIDIEEMGEIRELAPNYKSYVQKIVKIQRLRNTHGEIVDLKSEITEDLSRQLWTLTDDNNSLVILSFFEDQGYVSKYSLCKDK